MEKLPLWLHKLWGVDPSIARLAEADITRLTAENERLRGERDEARGLLAEYVDDDTAGCECDYDDSGIECFYCRAHAFLNKLKCKEP